STYGPISRAVSGMRANGHDVSHIHIRHIWPLPENLGELLRSYKTVIVPEMNTGQLVTVLRSEYLVDCKPVNKVNGKPFRIVEIEDAIQAHL
ncbi:MAG: 2-oxoglutarate ferredoxin oxidoreductase subunit alpha, partial [Rhodospirillaceae bacterium]|nr:2-oxoglutarate ferredoxin oxidoreductase subunit alpha [Rhodospirillaceae bacterium]